MEEERIDLLESLEYVSISFFNLLKEKNLTISFVEGATAGLVSSSLAYNDNYSELLKGSYVLLDSKLLESEFKVSSKTISKDGLNSKKCATEIIKNLMKKKISDVGSIITFDEKNQETIFFGFFVNDKYVVEKQVFDGSKDEKRIQAAMYVFYRLSELLEKGFQK